MVGNTSFSPKLWSIGLAVFSQPSWFRGIGVIILSIWKTLVACLYIFANNLHFMTWFYHSHSCHLLQDSAKCPGFCQILQHRMGLGHHEVVLAPGYHRVVAFCLIFPGQVVFCEVSRGLRIPIKLKLFQQKSLNCISFFF